MYIARDSGANAKAAAILLNSNPKTVKRLATRGEIPAIQIGNRWKLRAKELDEWLRRGLLSHGHPLPQTAGCERTVIIGTVDEYPN